MKKITNGYVLEVTEEVIDDHGDIDYRRETYTYYRPLKPENCIEKNGKLVSYRYGSDTLNVSSEKPTRNCLSYDEKSPYHSVEEREIVRIRKLEADGCIYEGSKLVYCDRAAEGCVRPIKRFYMVEDGAFKDCTKLEQVILPEGVEEIGHYAFFGCTNLKKSIFRRRSQESA